MEDLTSTTAMLTKAVLFLLLSLLCGLGLWMQSPHIVTVLLAAVLAWSAARLYYFLFYVLRTYVDASRKYSGLIAIIGSWTQRHRP